MVIRSLINWSDRHLTIIVMKTSSCKNYIFKFSTTLKFDKHSSSIGAESPAKISVKWWF